MSGSHGRIDLEKVEVGDILWECQSGYNMKVEVLTKPELKKGEGFEGRDQWIWQGKIDGRPAIFLVTVGLEHYGPKLYNMPQYVSLDFFEK